MRSHPLPHRRTGGIALLTALTALSGVLATPASAHGRGEHPVPGATLPSACSGTAPIVCHFDVPPGNYDVTALLGGATTAATDVTAEQRRTVLAETATEAGHPVRRGFTVNVRAVEGEPTGDVGSEGLDLVFGGSAPLLSGLRVTPARHTPQILLVGDSTVCDQPADPYVGWGQELPQRLRRGVAVANYADSGESTVSFLDNPLLFDQVESKIRRGDLVLVQLAHNDKTTTAEEYRANLTEMAQRVRAHGGEPVFVTPMVRRRFNSDGTLNSVALHVMAANLPVEMRALAAELEVPLVDLTQLSKDLVEGLGVEKSKDIYLTDINGDNTHLSAYGATTYAELVLGSLRDQGLVSERLVR
ncbi:rhamnogalacturonan acetylesterase [Streptomyces sp. NPDC090106]|uniref:rhamnogalacturonan acetylesterase n=1 Tax=Streptomyces sp. NPDC090106 TaxID=3365946 RepID=UPI00382D8B4D